jgi:uncharacterized lipoprotein YddW (UPF0748 family)
VNITHALLRAPLLVAVIACLIVAGREPRAASEGAEVRALWVTRSSLVSPERVAAMVRSAAASGFNTLLV